MAESTGTFSGIVSLWSEKIRLADEHKQEKFQRYADEAMRFYNGPHDFMFESQRSSEENGATLDGEIHPQPLFRMTANLVYEAASLFLPSLYYRNPVRVVTPAKNELPEPVNMMIPQNPLMQAELQKRAALIGLYLNKTPHMTDLLGNSRSAILEAFVKGRGVLWPGLIEGPGYFVVGSEYDSVDHLFIDPDAEMLKDAGWIARRRIRRCREVERDFDLPAGSCKPNRGESSHQQSKLNITRDDSRYRSKQADDLIEYYEVYSRIGMGSRKQAGEARMDASDEFWDSVGQHVYLVIAPSCDYPLNLPPYALEGLEPEEALQAVIDRTGWPTEFYLNTSHPWPFAPLDFHEVPRCVWPASHVQPALGYQRFLNWAMSFLASKVYRTSRDGIAVNKGCEESYRKGLFGGKDLFIVEKSQGHTGTSTEGHEYIQFPPMNQDLLGVVNMCRQEWNNMIGTNELLQGNSGKQMRSAQEAAVRDKYTSVRPDDMGNRVEDWQGLISLMELMVARKHLRAEDVAAPFNEKQLMTPPLGEEPAPDQAPFPYMGPLTSEWMNSIHTEDVTEIVNEFECRIEAGSAKKPNKVAQLDTVQQATQMIWPDLIQQYRMTGDPSEVNKFLRMMGKAQDWTDDIQFPDMRQMMMQQQQMAAAAQSGQPQGGEQGPPPEQVAA